MTLINSNYCIVVGFHRENEVLVHADFSIADSTVMVTIAIEMVVTLLVCEMIVVTVVANEDQQHQHHHPTKVIPITKSKVMKIQRISRNLGADSIANQSQRPMSKTK